MCARRGRTLCAPVADAARGRTMPNFDARIDRRSFLRNAALLAGGAALLPRGVARAAAPSFVGALTTHQLTGAGEIWAWQNCMTELGPRLPGSPQHLAYLDFIEEQCARAGLTTFHDPTQYYPRWEADYTQCALSILESGGAATPLEAVAYFLAAGNTTRL